MFPGFVMFASIIAMAAAAPIQPTGKWVVDFADNACVLSRQYGAGEDQFSANFKAPLLGKQFELVIARPEKHPDEESYDEGWIEKPDGRRIEPIKSYSYSTVAKTRLTRVSFDPERYTVGEDGERLNLHINAKRAYDLAMPDFKAALSVLDVCLKDLRKVHGVDEATLARIATPAKTSGRLLSAFSTEDYPSAELDDGGQGNVGVLYWIETDGRVRDCKVIETSHRPRLDEKTCQVIKYQVKFKPALDAAGKPIRSPDYSRMRWRVGS